MLHFALFAGWVPLTAAHGEMTHPPTRSLGSYMRGGSCKVPGDPEDTTAENGLCRWFNQGCQPGCSGCVDFDKNTCTPMNPTLNDPELLTWQRGNRLGHGTKHNPWRSPGFAPVFSPCGIAGGGATYHPSNGALPPQGIPQGRDGKDMPELADVETIWPAGSVQEVAWAIHANHGGGYAYRLCPKSAEATEECFQSHHLTFASDQTWIQYGSDSSNRTAIKAHRVSVGTNPPNSQWTKNPLPACGDKSGGVSKGANCAYPPMFEEPFPGFYGYGAAACSILTEEGGNKCSAEEEATIREKFSFNIIDTVKVPSNLPPGGYLLSFRWDVEQTPQVWAQCADVTIVATDGNVAV